MFKTQPIVYGRINHYTVLDLILYGSAYWTCYLERKHSHWNNFHPNYIFFFKKRINLFEGASEGPWNFQCKSRWKMGESMSLLCSLGGGVGGVIYLLGFSNLVRARTFPFDTFISYSLTHTCEKYHFCEINQLLSLKTNRFNFWKQTNTRQKDDFIETTTTSENKY